MARKMNLEVKTTPISITKHQKSRLRMYAEPIVENVKNESDSLVLERILAYYEVNHVLDNPTPKPTYYSKI